MKTPHKHAKEIKAWADGATIQWRSGPRSNWEDLKYPYPAWNVKYEYRVKPSVEIPEDFTPWLGGIIPVDPKSRVEIILRRGATNYDLATNFDWIHHGYDCDIIAYKVIKKAPVVRWQWIIKNEHTTFFTLTIAFFTEREARAEFSNSIVGKAEWTRMEFDK